MTNNVAAPAEEPENNNPNIYSSDELVEAYGGFMNANASHRSYIDIQPNISVRTEMTRRDYNRFRTSEGIPDDSKGSIRMCMEAYKHIGIIKNIIDLMGDFASQGITLNHPDKKVQKFYRVWWNMVRGTERSERFLNTLYRCGNVICRRRYSKLNKKMRYYMSKAKDMVDVEKLETEKYTVPMKYDILNPLQVSVQGGMAGIFFGKPKYQFNISPLLSDSIKSAENRDVFDTLPDSIKKAINSDKKMLDLDPADLMVYHYKKDDWQLWADPFIYAILDDLVMLEKFKLADMSALDGAISNIRLWTLGSLDHKIMPSRAAVDKLRDILASNVGGGTMDLVWGPEISFQESATQVYHFLGNEKYIPVLNSIYAGLGIPPTLTGLAGQSGGYTNNFISLKTLIDRLQYGRALLEEFWNKEIKLVQKAMGFTKPAKLHFEHMLVADEASEKNLLLALVDRGFVSVETLRERFGEDTEIETSRLKSEYKDNKKRDKLPMAGPFFNGNVDTEIQKLALQKGLVGVQDISDIDPKHAPPVNDFTPKAPEGRPPFKKDTSPRKQKVVKPKTSPSKAILWVSKAHKEIFNTIQTPLLSLFNKKNLRDLTREERKSLDDSVLSILSNLPLYAELNIENISKANKVCNPNFRSNLTQLINDFIVEYNGSPSTSDMQQLISLAYVDTFCE